MIKLGTVSVKLEGDILNGEISMNIYILSPPQCFHTSEELVDQILREESTMLALRLSSTQFEGPAHTDLTPESPWLKQDAG